MLGLHSCATWDGYVSVGCIAVIFLVIGSEECSKVSMGCFLKHAYSSSLGQESLCIPRSCDVCLGNSSTHAWSNSLAPHYLMFHNYLLH